MRRPLLLVILGGFVIGALLCAVMLLNTDAQRTRVVTSGKALIGGPFELAGEDGKTVGNKQEITPPPHEPGTFPKWLHEQGATVIIAGGMGSRAQSLFGQNDIQVVVGASGGEPDAIVRSFLEGRLETGANICDH